MKQDPQKFSGANSVDSMGRTEQDGVDSYPKEDNSAPAKNSQKDNKRFPFKHPSGRGRSNLVPTFPGKDGLTPM